MKRFVLGIAIFAIAATANPAFAQNMLAHRGQTVAAALQEQLDSGKEHDGDTFTLVARDTLFTKDGALKGATIEGHLENVTAASSTHKATMNMIFDDVRTADGTVAPISATVSSIKELEPKTHHIRDVGFIVGGAVAGHMLSKHTGHKGGTLAGAAAGFALASSMKSNIVVHRGTIVKLKLASDVVANGNAS